MPFILITLYGIALCALTQVALRCKKKHQPDKDEFVDLNIETIRKNHKSELAHKVRNNPFKARIGISISTLYDLDLSAGSYYASGFVWLKYTETPKWMKDWDPEVYDCPIKTIYFSNIVDAQSFETSLEPSQPIKDEDGCMIQWLEYSGRFMASGDDLDLRMFPFETISLSLCTELDDVYIGESEVEYAGSGLAVTSTPRINGYTFKGYSVDACMHIYKTNWGYAYANEYFNKNDYCAYQAFRLQAALTRDKWNSFVNIFLPLIIVMIVVIAAPLVAIQDYQTKLAIPASALLVLVFLQDGYKKILPPGLNYPTLADLVYIYNMLITIVVFLWSLIQTKLYFAAQATGAQAQQITSAGDLDNQFFAITLIFSVLGPVLFYASCKRQRPSTR